MFDGRTVNTSLLNNDVTVRTFIENNVSVLPDDWSDGGTYWYV